MKSNCMVRHKKYAHFHATLFVLIMFAVLNLQSRLLAANLGFAGEELDTEAGLVNLRARYYDPNTGTFISKDPIGIQGSINGYAYVNANPVNMADPTGNNPVIIALLVGYLLFHNSDVANAPAPGGPTYGSGGTGGIVLDGASMVAGAGAGNLASYGLSNASIPIISTISKLVPGNAATIITADGTQLSANLAQVTYSETMSVAGAKVVGESTVDALADSIAQGAQPAVGYIETGGGDALIANTRTFMAYSRTGVDPLFVEGDATVAGRVSNQLLNNGLDMAGTPFALSENTVSGIANGLGNTVGVGTYAALNSGPNDVGGVLIDQAATLVGTNLSSIQGATFDPVSKQIIFLGSVTC